MRKQRTRRYIVAVLFGLGFYVILVIAEHPCPGITRENFERIQKGMTEADVEEILGGPPGTYTDRRINFFIFRTGVSFRRWWLGDEGVITIVLTFDVPRRVSSKKFDPMPDESLDERFRRKYPWLIWWE